MNTADLDYKLPERLIAQYPAERRDEARLLILDKSSGVLQTDLFKNLPKYLRAQDCIVLNDTKVVRARLKAVKRTGGRVEIFLLKEEQPGQWTALVRPSAKLKPGTPVLLAGGLEATIAERLPGGQRRVLFEQRNVLALLEARGEIPLPPYIRRDAAEASDLERYQTVFAKTPGAIAAPTAGLHYTPEVFAALEAAQIQTAFVTLHVGYGTFKPITADRLEDHRVDPEDFTLAPATAQKLNTVRAQGGRIAAAGTTATRVLETQCQDGQFQAGEGSTSIYCYPPYAFRGIDLLQTNFHLPKSSLLALVCAFAGRDLVMEAYHHAIKEQFRFYSYGDAMLIR